MIRCMGCDSTVDDLYRYCPYCGLMLEKLNFSMFPSKSKNIKYAFTDTGNSQLTWLKPVSDYMRLPLSKRIQILKMEKVPKVRNLLSDDMIIAMLKSVNNHNTIISLMRDIPQFHTNKALRVMIRELLENRIKDINYKSHMKKTIIKDYLKYLIENNQKKRIYDMMKEIKNHNILIIFLQEYIKLDKDIPPQKYDKLVKKIKHLQ